MHINWKAAVALLIVVGVVLGTVLGITFARASGGGGGAQYGVTLKFNTSVTEGDLDEVGRLLRSYDEGVEFLIMERFPPIGRAVLATDAPDFFCGTVEAELEAKSYVDDVSCQPRKKEGGESDLTSVSQDESAEIAEDFVLSSATYEFDGIDGSLELVDVATMRCPYCWAFTFQFQSAHPGHGDRSGDMLAQVITDHIAVVAVREGEVVSAVEDGEWDMLTERFISADGEGEVEETATR